LNPNLTWKIVSNDISLHPDNSWDFESLSKNPMNRQPAVTKIQRIFRKYRKIKRFKCETYFQLRKLFDQYLAKYILSFVRV